MCENCQVMVVILQLMERGGGGGGGGGRGELVSMLVLATGVGIRRGHTSEYLLLGCSLLREGGSIVVDSA